MNIKVLMIAFRYFSIKKYQKTICHVGYGGAPKFHKNYEINKLPYVLILSLKRFKYNENNNFKLKQLITYPLDNFQLKDKKYNLFGVVYHYGSINSGHYICSIRLNKKWIVCDDNSI